MSGVCGYQRRCLDDECPFSVCDGCPIAYALDLAGIDKAESRQQVLDAIAAVQEVES